VIVERMTARSGRQTVISTEQLIALQQAADRVYVDPALYEYAVRLATATRAPASLGLAELERYITFGASPRASINLILTARALAFVRGRDYALPDDVLDMALDVLRHRIVLSFEALSDDISADDLGRSSAGSTSRRPLRDHGTSRQRRRILQRLDWKVVRRLDGLLQGATGRAATASTSPTCASTSPGRRPVHRWNVTRMDVLVPQYHEDRESPPGPADLKPSVDFGRCRRAPEAGGLIDFDPRPVADPPRQPGRSDVLRRPARTDDPAVRRIDPPADQRPAGPATSRTRSSPT
jgi:hypothetical protein